MTRTNGSGAAQPRTTLQFFGKAVAVKVNVPKQNPGYSSSGEDAGSIDVTFRIEAPKRPRDPAKSRYDWQVDRQRQVVANPRPTTKKEQAAWDKAKAEVDAYELKCEREDEVYRTSLAAVAAATMAYAQLAGICAVFANQRLSVTLQPAEQDLLPGMGVNVLLTDSQLAVAKAEEAAEALADEDDLIDDDEDWDEAAEMVASPAPLEA